MSFLLRKVEDVTTIIKPQSLTSVRIKDCTLRVPNKLLRYFFLSNNKSNLHSPSMWSRAKCQCNAGAEGDFDANCTLCAPSAVRDVFASGPAACAPPTLAVVVNWLHCHQVSKNFSHFCLWILYHQNFHNNLKFTTDGLQNQTSQEKGTGAAY